MLYTRLSQYLFLVNFVAEIKWQLTTVKIFKKFITCASSCLFIPLSKYRGQLKLSTVNTSCHMIPEFLRLVHWNGVRSDWCHKLGAKCSPELCWHALCRTPWLEKFFGILCKEPGVSHVLYSDRDCWLASCVFPRERPRFCLMGKERLQRTRVGGAKGRGAVCGFSNEWWTDQGNYWNLHTCTFNS